MNSQPELVPFQIGETVTKTGRDRYVIIAIRDNGDIDCIGGKPQWGRKPPTRNHRTFHPHQIRRPR